jgi:citrate lyase subunit beta/citryl-CoA lyase/(S)-citramalyl-CoA lyase
MLSTPASVVDRFSKGHKSGADICVVDLEDSIPPWQKAEARRKAEEFFSAPSASATRCGVRINAVTEPDGLRDLLALRRYPVKPSVVVVPMVESARDIEIVERVLGRTCPELEVFGVIETPRGLERVNEIATVSPRLRALIFGAADYSFAVGARLSWESLVHARARVVNSARAANIEVVDSPVFDLSDASALKREAPLARELGFSGKIAVHPQQIPVINEAFSPDALTMERARRIVAAGHTSSNGIAVVEGQMVGLPFFEASQRLIEEFGPSTDSVMPATTGGER